MAARRLWFIMHRAAKAPCRRRPVSSTLGRTTKNTDAKHAFQVAMTRSRSRKKKRSNRIAEARRAIYDPEEQKRDDEIRAFWRSESRKLNNARASKAAGLAALFCGPGIVIYCLTIGGPPFEGKGAALAESLYDRYGSVGPALPWVGLSILFAFVSLAAARDWGEKTD